MMERAAIWHVVCPHCTARNRYPVGKPAAGAHCGKCHAMLFEGHPIAVGAAEFERTAGATISPCSSMYGRPGVMAPMFERAAAELEPDVRLIKLNADEEPGLSAQLGVSGIPTMILLRGGEVVAQTAGAMNTPQIVAWARSRLGDLEEAGPANI